MLKNKSVINFQAILGLVMLGAVGLFAWSHLGGLGTETRPVRAESEARELARAILDYRHDTGNWPRNQAGDLDMNPLVGRGDGAKPVFQASTTASGVFPAEAPAGSPGPRNKWLREIPLDPWGNPFRVMLGVHAVAVLSLGPNQLLDTDLNRLWTRPENINPGDGDDVGFVLEFELDGES